MTEEIKHIETFIVNAKGKGWPTQVDVVDTEWDILVDEPIEDGGTNSGPNPMQYFTASLAACQNEQAQVVAEELELNINAIEIDLEVDLDLGGFMGMVEDSSGSYKEVRLNAKVSGDVTAEQVLALGIKVDLRCPILSLLRTSGTRIVSSWEVG